MFAKVFISCSKVQLRTRYRAKFFKTKTKESECSITAVHSKELDYKTPVWVLAGGNLAICKIINKMKNVLYTVLVQNKVNIAKHSCSLGGS